MVLLAASVFLSVLPAEAHHDFFSTTGRIEAAMNSLQSEFPATTVGCSDFYIQNNRGCGFNTSPSDKNWPELGYSAFAVFGREPGEHQNEFAYMASIYTDRSSPYNKAVTVGSHSGWITSAIEDGMIHNWLWWGDGRSVLALFTGSKPAGADFDSLEVEEKQARVGVIQSLAIEYAQKLETKLVQFEAYDATTPYEEKEKKRLPIIFIPGVGGSRLSNAGHSLWPIPAPFHMTDLFLKSDGKAPINNGVNVAATDILRAAPGNFYGGLVKFLQTKNYTLNNDLFLFPYDWRLDNNDHLVSLDSLVNTVLKKTDSEKVILIAHSMGGLISRAYVQTLGASKVDTLITIGTPFYGAVKPYYALVHGYDFDNLAVTNLGMKIMAQNAPAVYQILPRVPFVTDILTKDSMPLSQSYSVRYKAVLEGRVSYYESEKNEWHFNDQLLEKANAFHSILGTKQAPAPLPSGVRHYVIIGTGVSTLSGFELQDIVSDKKYSEVGDRKVVHVPDFGPGDGTVPLWSAQIDGVTATYYVTHTSSNSAEHGSLTDNNEVRAIVWNTIDGFPPDSDLYQPDSLAVTDTTDFTLHSNAHLSVVDAETGALAGYDSAGEPREGIDSGTFVVTENGEYASFSDASKTYRIIVNGIEPGEFSLFVDLKGSKLNERASFSYRNVSVDEQTTASLEISPTKIRTSADVPALDVAVRGPSSEQPVISSVPPKIDTMSLGTSSGQGGSGSNTGGDGGGGCLIATAAFGSELSPQVMFLRNFRDHRIMSTMSGASFMTAFNTWYYSFSPQVADYEREQPWLQQMIKISIYPLFGILHVSEAAYTAIPGEYGALSAGLVASSLIGGVYLSPLALSIKQVRKARIEAKVLGLIIAAPCLAVIMSIITTNQLLLTVTTPILVITTIVVSAIVAGRTITMVSSRLKCLIGGHRSALGDSFDC